MLLVGIHLERERVDVEVYNGKASEYLTAQKVSLPCVVSIK